MQIAIKKYGGNVKMDIFGGKWRFQVPKWLNQQYNEGEVLFHPGTRLVYKGLGDGGEYMFDQEGFDRGGHERPPVPQLEEQFEDNLGHGKGDLHILIDRKPKSSTLKYDEFKNKAPDTGLGGMELY